MQTLPLQTSLTSAQITSLIQQASADYTAQIEQVARQIIADDDHIVLLAGPSGSGKTTTARLLGEQLHVMGKQVHYISLDDFYRDHQDYPVWEDGQHNYETVEALDIPLFVQTMQTLTINGKTELPLFNFEQKCRQSKGRWVDYTADTVLIFEGIHALNPRLQEGLPTADCYRIYVSVHADYVGEGLTLPGRYLRFLRRLIRDSWDRDTNAIGTLNLWGYVLRGEVEYIQPYRHTAEMHINSAHSYEPYLYAPIARRLLQDLPADHAQTEMVTALLDVLPQLPSIAVDQVPAEALMQEFMQGLCEDAE